MEIWRHEPVAAWWLSSHEDFTVWQRRLVAQMMNKYTINACIINKFASSNRVKLFIKTLSAPDNLVW